LIADALLISNIAPKDSHRTILKSPSEPIQKIPNDPEIFKKSIEEILNELEGLEKEILKTDSKIKKVIRLVYEVEKNTNTLSNSYGLSLKKEETATSFQLEVLGEKGNQTEVGWDFIQSRFANKLDLKGISQEMAQHVVKSLGGKSLPTGKYSALIHPRVGVQFLGLLTEALSAHEVQLGKSFLKGKKGFPFASSVVNMMDDPFLPTGVASAPFDDEGVMHKKQTVIDNGILKTYFYDLRTASKEGVKSTGNGIRVGVGAEPKPGPTNFFVEAKNTTQDEMLNSAKNVFLIHDVMGLHMADPMTGEFSLGASGFFYENGKLVHPVRGVTIAGQLNQLFQKITSVGSDLRWYGHLGCPSLLISDLTIAGS